MNAKALSAEASRCGLLGTWSFLLCVATAHATSLLPEPVDAGPFKCLTRVEGSPTVIEYPERAGFGVEGGTVRVRMEFFDRSKGPLVETLSSPSREHSDAVERFVEYYRLPCFKSGGQRAFAIQEFVFRPNDGTRVTWFAPAAVGPAKDECKVVGAEDAMLYPPKAIRDYKQGRVLARATFEGPGLAPEVIILHGGGHRALDEAVSEAMGQLRVECGPSGGRWPRQVVRLYMFVIEGGARATFKDVDLKTFVASIDKLDSHKVRFDLSSMGCPFEVALALNQPFAANEVGEIGRPDPNREAFLVWLRSVALRLPPKAMDELLGSTMHISVPCGLLDLTS